MKHFPFTKGFLVASYDFKIRFRKNCVLGQYPGLFFRSAVGRVLHEIYCKESFEDCGECPSNQSCIYAILHDAPFNKNLELDFNMSRTNFPKPFFMTPPMVSFCGGFSNDLSVEIVLIGKSAGLIKEIVSAFKIAGEYGLGKDRLQFDLVSVADSIHRTPLYENGKFVSGDVVLFSVDQEKDEMRPVSISIDFITPVRIEKEKKLISRITFCDIWKSLVKRLSVLSAVYGGEIVNSNTIKQSIELSKNINLSKCLLKRAKLDRYSATQDSVIPLDGYTGKLFFNSVPTGFLPILKTGEMIHVGKGITSGNGKYILRMTGQRIIVEKKNLSNR